MSINISIRRTIEGPRKAASGLAGAFGATVPSGTEIEEVEVSAPKSVNLDRIAAAGAAAFSTAHGHYLTDDTLAEGGSAIFDESVAFEEGILAESNLVKVREAFLENGLGSGIASDVITTMQNKGILFRERPSHGETTENVTADLVNLVEVEGVEFEMGFHPYEDAIKALEDKGYKSAREIVGTINAANILLVKRVQ